MTEERFELEVYDPLTASWELLDGDDRCGVEVSWGLDAPASLTRYGEPLDVRFRLWEIVSAGTDRWLALEAIPGLTLYARAIESTRRSTREA